MLSEEQKTSLVNEFFDSDFDDNEMPTDFIVLVATRTLEGGGSTYLTSGGSPAWALEGLLRRGISIVNASATPD